MVTTIGLYDRTEDAERAAEALRGRGFNASEIGIVTDEHVVHGYRTTRAVVLGNDSAVKNVSGGAMVSVLADDAQSKAAEEILRTAGAASVETRPGAWGQWGSSTAVDVRETEEEEAKPHPLLDIEVDKGGT